MPEQQQSLRDRYAAIEARLVPTLAGPEREAVKREIIALFKAVEAQLADLTALKDEVKGLVDRWKQQGSAAPSQAPQFTGEKPVVHSDHIGASTFIEATLPSFTSIE